MKVGTKSIKLNTKITRKYSRPEDVPFWQLYLVEIERYESTSTFMGITRTANHTRTKVVHKYPMRLTMDEMRLLIETNDVDKKYKYHAYPRDKR